MKYSKEWMSIDQQVELLTEVKGLECDDASVLKSKLETLSYYRLSAYWFPFKEPGKMGLVDFAKARPLTKS